MAKIALLIGVSEYELDFNPLPCAVKDVEAMQRVLVNPEMGNFTEADITMLKNPQRQDIEDAIFNLFHNRQKHDLLLFYFSGHGIKDDRGKLHLSTCTTKKLNGKLVTPSAVAGSVLHDNMNDSRSQRIVIILDCCFSGAIAQGMTVKDDNSVNVQEQLGGKGRAILTSSTSTQYSFEQEGSELSIYTRYLVEGIEKGAADKDGDGWISVDELHEYASSKVQEAAPAMTPKFYPVEEGSKILLAKSHKDDPKVKYRKEVESRAKQNQGKFSIFARRIIDLKRDELRLSLGEAAIIEEEVLQPYREYERKRDEYERALQEATINEEYPFNQAVEQDLQEYQKYLVLRDEDISSIKQRVLAQKQAEYERQQLKRVLAQQKAEYENKLQRYEQELFNALKAGYPLDEFVRDGLKNFQQFLGLGDEDIASIEQQVLVPKQAEYERQQQQQKAKYEHKLHRYEQELCNALKAGYPLDDFAYTVLQNFQQFLGLGDEDIASIKQRVLAPKEAEYERQQQESKRLNQQQEKIIVRGDDLKLDLKLDFWEAIFGGEKEIRISHTETCDICSGSGSKSGTRPRTCSTCSGSGQKRRVTRTPFGSFIQVSTCFTCNGTGMVIKDKCNACDGKGANQVTKKLKITIPAGVDNRMRLRVANEGDAGQYGKPSGDLYIYLFVNEDAEFQRDGINILSNIKISQLQATSGCRLQVNTIDGSSVELIIPPGTQPNAVMKLKNRGVPHLGNPTSRGDHLITVQIVT